jgi:hypothetical protein
LPVFQSANPLIDQAVARRSYFAALPAAAGAATGGFGAGGFGMGTLTALPPPAGFGAGGDIIAPLP